MNENGSAGIDRHSWELVDQSDRATHRTAKGRAGQSLVNVAATHELGSRPIVMKLTQKTRACLHAAFCKAGLDAPGTGRPSTGIAVVHVRARPFLSPVFERYAQPDEVSQRFLERVAANLHGDCGAAELQL